MIIKNNVKSKKKIIKKEKEDLQLALLKVLFAPIFELEKIVESIFE